MSYALRMEGGTLKIEFSGTFTNEDLVRGAMDVADLEDSSALIPHRIADLRPVQRLEINFIGVLALAEARRSRRFKNPFKEPEAVSWLALPDLEPPKNPWQPRPMPANADVRSQP